MGYEKSARRGFFSKFGSMDSQEDSASAVWPGLLVSLVDVYERKRCLNWIRLVYRQVLRKVRVVLLAGRASAAWKIVRAMFRQVSLYKRGRPGTEARTTYYQTHRRGRPGTKAKVVSQLAPGRQLSIQAYCNFPRVL